MTTAGSDVEGVQTGVTEGTVGRPVGGYRVGLKDAARGSEDIYHRPWPGLPPASAGDDVTLGIQAHAIQTSVDPLEVLSEYMQYGEASQGVVVPEGIGS